MTDAWPVSLPQAFELSGYGEGMPDGMLEVQPDTGPPIRRLRSTSSVRIVNGSMTLTTAQKTTFENFFNVTLGFGVFPFTFPVQISPATNWLVEFPKNSLPRLTPMGGGYWKLSITLMVLP